MTDSNVITSFLVLLGSLLLARAFLPLFWRTPLDGFALYATRFVTVTAIATAGRTFYWDVVPVVLDEHWQALFGAMGGQEFSTLFNVLYLVAIYDALKAREALIPEDERHKWPWWLAWAHPGKRCIIRRFKR